MWKPCLITLSLLQGGKGLIGLAVPDFTVFSHRDSEQNLSLAQSPSRALRIGEFVAHYASSKLSTKAKPGFLTSEQVYLMRKLIPEFTRESCTRSSESKKIELYADPRSRGPLDISRTYDLEMQQVVTGCYAEAESCRALVNMKLSGIVFLMSLSGPCICISGLCCISDAHVSEASEAGFLDPVFLQAMLTAIGEDTK